MTKLMVENEALVEWQVARLAAACNTVATAHKSPAARREALRLKAAFATSSYSIVAGPNALVQVLDLLSMATLSRQLWVEEGLSAGMFGEDGKVLEEAFSAIHRQVEEHARRHLSAAEVQPVEETVRAWRKAHPSPVVGEFIRFDAFADELAVTLAGSASDKGVFARIRSVAHNAEMLGERAIFLASRMPRLTEWHAEAAAANLIASGEINETLAAVRELAQMPRVLQTNFNTLDEHLAALPANFKVLDERLATLPAQLARALAKQPEYNTALTHLEQSGQRLKSLEGSIQELDRQVASLTRQLEQLTALAQPDALRTVMEQAGGVPRRKPGPGSCWPPLAWRACSS